MCACERERDEERRGKTRLGFWSLRVYVCVVYCRKGGIDGAHPAAGMLPSDGSYLPKLKLVLSLLLLLMLFAACSVWVCVPFVSLALFFSIPEFIVLPFFIFCLFFGFLVPKLRYAITRSIARGFFFELQGKYYRDSARSRFSGRTKVFNWEWYDLPTHRKSVNSRDEVVHLDD